MVDDLGRENSHVQLVCHGLPKEKFKFASKSSFTYIHTNKQTNTLSVVHTYLHAYKLEYINLHVFIKGWRINKGMYTYTYIHTMLSV